jgi:hypothetical protein
VTYSDFEETFSSSSGGRGYASNATGAWAVETIQPAPSIAGWIALDAAGEVQVLYSDRIGGLHRAVRGGGTWNVMPLEMLRGAAAVAVDGAGQAHVMAARSEGLSYLAETGTGAQPALLATDFDGWTGNVALALDAGATAHVAYQTAAGGLRYATNGSGAWQTRPETLNPGRQAQGVALRLDGGGRPHVAYHDWNSGTLRYARPGVEIATVAGPRPGRWAADTVAGAWSSLLGGAETTLAFDGRGRLHMVYAFKGGGACCSRVDHAVRGDAGWTTTIGIGDFQGGWRTGPLQMVFSGENVDLIYEGAVGLRHATNRSGAWVNRVLTEEGVGPTALAVGAAGEVHVLFTTAVRVPKLRWQLRHLVASDPTVIDTVDADLPDLGANPLLTIERDGTAHAAYTARDGLLRHAVLRAGAWTVERTPLACWPQAIEVDGTGTHVTCAAWQASRLTSTGAGLWTDERSEAIPFSGSGGLVLGPDRRFAFGAAVESARWVGVATNASGSWLREMIAASGSGLSLVFDGAGVLHAGYFDNQRHAVVHAIRQTPEPQPCDAITW